VKFLPLIVANLLRKKVRTTLTVGSFAVALFLFGILVAVRTAFGQGVQLAGVDRLMVLNRASIAQPLSKTYGERLLRIPGVKLVTAYTWFGGVYQDEKNFFAQFALDPETQREMYPEFLMSDADWKAFQEDKAGCFAGEALAKRFQWKVGDTITIRGTFLEGLWEFHLRGIYKGSRPEDDTTQFWFHQDYMYEKSPAFMKGLVGWYVVKIANPDAAPAVAKAIDAQFANSAWETRTQTEREMQSSFAKQMGNIEFLVMSIGSVVFFTLLLVTGNTLAIAIRERSSEIAVLKALGYSDPFIVGLVLAEATVIAIAGASLGLALVRVFTSHGDPTGGLMPGFYVSWGAVFTGLGLAILVALAGGVLPALSVARLRVVDALRKV
jgi:putative ABC transport system permease protein